MRTERARKKIRRDRWRKLSIFIGASLCLVVGILFGRIIPQTSASSKMPASPVSTVVAHTTRQKPPAARPTTISIPSIGVDTIIAHAGLREDGAMDIPKNPDQVAWYEFGTRPGDEGSAVIAGHSGWTGSHGSIFNDLYKLQKGDRLSVLDQAGSTKTFIVTGTKEYSPTADATSVFQSSDGKAHLNLITCDGVWVNATNSDSSRLVVFTDLEQK